MVAESVRKLANEKPILCLMGPTAVGKTATAFEIVDKFDCEIISVDSALIYRGMNIGTAKPDQDSLKKYPHHLVDIINPTESYSVAEFRKAAISIIEDIHRRNKIPLLVGGTMMYFNALEKGLSDLPESNAAIRKELQNAMETHGLEALHKQLEKIDPKAAQRIHKNDTQRVLRALEVWKISGKSLTQLQIESNKNNPAFSVVKLGISCSDRSLLHRRIAARFEQMLNEGFIEEVEALRRLYPDLNSEYPAMRSVGYRQVWRYLDGEFDRIGLFERGVAATRQLAKRQLTWLRSMDSLNWFDCQQDFSQQILEKIGESLQ